MGNWLHRETITDMFEQQRCHWKPLPLKPTDAAEFTSTQFRRIDHLAPKHLWIAEPQPYCSTQPELKDLEYRVCVSHGKPDGYRMTVCSSYYMSYNEMMSWLSRKQGEEARGPRRTWEYPYVYTAYPKNWKGNLVSVLGKKPVMIDDKERIVV